MTADVVVAGAGLAGACAALTLSRTHRVVVLDTARPASGASGAAAGIVNPFMGRKASPAWRSEEALAALAALLDEAGAPDRFRRTGVLRPAADARQQEAFVGRTVEHPDRLAWLPREAVVERFPLVVAPRGALFVHEGGHVDLAGAVHALLREVERRGGVVLSGRRLVGWSTGIARTDAEAITCPHLVLAVGDGAFSIPPLASLPLHRVKGQTLRLTRPAVLPPDHPAIAGHGYVVPDADGVTVGATFEHDFVTTEPDPRRDAELRASAERLVPSLSGAVLVDRRAGVRLTVPAVVSPRRLPLAGALPGPPGVWVLTGLGAKGLLTAPLLAEALASAIARGTPMPAEVDPTPGMGRGFRPPRVA